MENVVAGDQSQTVQYSIPINRTVPSEYQTTYEYAGQGHGDDDKNLYFYLPAGQFTTLALISAENPVYIGQDAILTATVTPADATGTVDFYDGATSIGSTAIANGAAQLQISTLAAGTHNIKAKYSGDNNYFGSTSAVLDLVVEKVDYAIQTDAAPLEFGVLNESYTELPDPQTVRITNTGKLDITIKKPTSAAYTCSGSFPLVIAPALRFDPIRDWLPAHTTS